MEQRQIFQQEAAGLYRPEQEHDACGVGMVANIRGIASHGIVEQGLAVLRRLMHRGAAGSDPETGDGAGILVFLPDAFFRAESGLELPEAGRYGVGMVFGGVGQEQVVEQLAAEEGCPVIGWREVPVQPEYIGRTARSTAPRIRQVFVDGSGLSGTAELERRLYILRRRIEKSGADLYIYSLSARTVVYKGLLLAPQLPLFYTDLTDPRFTSPVALVHQRYSTNTFPAWHLAHPFRYVAHNGEINTLKGNMQALAAREKLLQSEVFGDDLQKILPLIEPGQSDSACLDRMLELLVAGGRSLDHAMMMLLPQAWGTNYHMGRDVRAFFEYHSALMEPWDGPSAVVFSDGINAGAMLDRNGLRPARYTLCKDGMFVLASETGVLDVAADNVLRKGRLKPGEMLLLDLQNHRLQLDGEIKTRLARRAPYRRWVEENRLSVHGLFTEVTAAEPGANLLRRQLSFGYTREDLDLILQPMATEGKEPIGSMGHDIPLAVLSAKPQLLFHYFKQQFAQVTNPPIDPIREELVMSLMTYIGNKGNILEETPEHARLIKLRRPILTDDELQRLEHFGGEPAVFTCSFPMDGGETALRLALSTLCSGAVQAVQGGKRFVVLSDRSLPDGHAAIPSLLATAAVNRALVEKGLRPEVGLIVQSGEVREIMHMALLLGYGATAVNPWLALQGVTALARAGKTGCDPTTAAGNYIQAVCKGLLKIMSKLGISTLRSYRSAQAFEAVGISREVVDEYFPGTVSRIGGISLADIAREACMRAAMADQDALPDGGAYRYRKDGEEHLWNPQTLKLFREAVGKGDYATFNRFSSLIDRQEQQLCTLRSLLQLKPAATPLPLEEVESVESIMGHFVSGAMSLGSLSPEAHRTIAEAMNRCGAMSNCGEGGENSDRFGTEFNSAIKQVASGRFGVTIEYLRNARELQIKMAQGAKPGEGGQLPGKKVDAFIAQVRHSMPSVTLISPPPHHDIYSIEDLAQLIFDLRNANPQARISVKLVSELGVGTVAAGVAKGDADVILISGYDGGTGASPLTSIRHAGLPWEIGLAEAHQTLQLNSMRGKVKLQVDGQIKTGRDIVVAALLGAEEFGFATTLLVCLGCAMIRKCHSNTCPMGVATQDPELRKRFSGKADSIVNFLHFVAQQAREHLAALGLHSLQEACGRSDLLTVDRARMVQKARGLDFSAILAPGTPAAPVVHTGHAAPETFDRARILHSLQMDGTRESLSLPVANTDRSIGTELSGELVSRYGAQGLAEDTITLKLSGTAGQSLGAFLAPGVTIRLTGEANDFVGKGLSGGKIVVRVPYDAAFRAEENVIAGNVIGYGGTSGQIFINGQAGERFGIRNSGMTLVAEGIGDHGCEYMTGGRVLILGSTGVNFAAGMTGGLAYVYDESGDFDLRCNVESVDLESVQPGSDAEAEILDLLHRHVQETGSHKAARILADWQDYRPRFVRVFPVEYRHALQAGLRGM